MYLSHLLKTKLPPDYEKYTFETDTLLQTYVYHGNTHLTTQTKLPDPPYLGESPIVHSLAQAPVLQALPAAVLVLRINQQRSTVLKQ